ncbi:hypothetical protein WP3W18E02_22380 [Klebsiella sp. WP3-W18-ESBL-02]|nr:hypothetical protein WP3W18E02_22380 [Klebsiella sp. WP3-W18-ESBL-02]BBR20729.1 hypothetical protein WP3S18E05_22090 [Klebsiella sp. WP3-S18-ESBL-05]
MMKFDTHFSFSAMVLLVLSALFPFVAEWRISLDDGALVTHIENGQALWLLFGAVFTVCYSKPWEKPAGEKQFWMWATLWWLVLLGRSTSWGRVYFPDAPRIVFHAIATVLVAGVLLSLLSSPLRKEIVRRIKDSPKPLWLMAVTVMTFLIADTIEHHRLLAPLFVREPNYADLMEELYEIPFMVGLFLTSFYFMKHDNAVSHSVGVRYQHNL